VVAGVPTADLPYAENQAAQVIAPTLTVTDVDGTTLLQATVTITANYGRRPRTCSTSRSRPAARSPAATPGATHPERAGEPGRLRAVLRTIAYRNTSDDPSALPRTVTFRVDTGAAANHLSAPVSRTVAVTAVNDRPGPG